jgi:hypothetical protein
VGWNTDVDPDDFMKIHELHIGMKVRHPGYGEGVVKALTELVADIRFADDLRKLAPETSGLEPAEAQASIQSLSVPLRGLIDQVVESTLNQIGYDNPNDVVHELGARWRHGNLVIKPAETGLQAKEVPLEVFFHKIVMLRNNLRILEQKINAHQVLSEVEKVEMQQYISKCHGSLTTFNILFKSEASQFKSK